MTFLFNMPTQQLNLVLELQDIATSDDPLEIHLQRAGWKTEQIKQIQESISEKLTIDMFNHQTRPLNAIEHKLQKDIQTFLDK